MEVASSKLQSPILEVPTGKTTSSPDRSHLCEIKQSDGRVGNTPRSESELNRSAETSKTLNPGSHAALVTTKLQVHATFNSDQRHTEKSHARKRRPRASSISSLSSSPSSEVTSLSENRSRPVNRQSTTGTHSKALHTPAKQSRVTSKSNLQQANRFSQSAKACPKPRFEDATPSEVPSPQVHHSSKRSLEHNPHPGRRASKHTAPISSVSLSSTVSFQVCFEQIDSLWLRIGVCFSFFEELR